MLLYSSDSSVDNLISIQVDSILLNKIIVESEGKGKIVKKINFRDANGFTNLIRGEDSKFSFIDEEKRKTCDLVCNVNCQDLIKPTKPTNIFIQKKDSVTGPTYLPPLITKKDEGIYVKKTTLKPRTFSKVPTTSTQKPSSTTARTTTQRSTTRPAVTSTLRQTYTQRTTTTQRSTTTQRPYTTQKQTKSSSSTPKRTTPAPRPRSSTPGPAYLPVAKKSTPKRATVTERSYPPATWRSTSRIATQTFPTWNAPIRRNTQSYTISTTTAKYLYKEPSNALSYAD